MVEEKGAPSTRKRDLTRKGCNAKVVFKMIIDRIYELVRFYDSHTHLLVSPRKRPFLTSKRKVNPIHKNLLCHIIEWLGASKAYHLIKEQVRGFQNVGCTKKDLQNCSKD